MICQLQITRIWLFQIPDLTQKTAFYPIFFGLKWPFLYPNRSEIHFWVIPEARRSPPAPFHVDPAPYPGFGEKSYSKKKSGKNRLPWKYILEPHGKPHKSVWPKFFFFIITKCRLVATMLFSYKISFFYIVFLHSLLWQKTLSEQRKLQNFICLGNFRWFPSKFRADRFCSPKIQFYSLGRSRTKIGKN